MTRRYCRFAGGLLSSQQQLPGEDHVKLAVPAAVAAARGAVCPALPRGIAAGQAVPVGGAQGSQSLKRWLNWR